MKAIIQKFTDEEKHKMAQLSSFIFDKMKELKFTLPMQLNAIDIIRRGLHDQEAVEKIIEIEKSGKTVWNDRELHVRKIVEGMHTSEINLVLFRDEADIYMMYHMGIFLSKPTIIIAEEKDKVKVEKLQHPLIKKRLYIPEFSEKYLSNIPDIINEVLDGQETKSR